MNQRVTAIDLLRGLAIIGMVLSGQMLWNASLPAALFHAQLPPPTFAFDPSVAGITWVDLVFPFFLFAMGAALPFALRRREEQGARTPAILRNSMHRWVWLAAFAIVLGNTRMGMLHDTKPWIAALATLTVWCLFFILFVRVPGLDRRRNAMLNWCGMGLLVVAVLLYRPVFGVAISVRSSDVIILILANMALFGTLAWWFTRSNVLLRACIVAAVVLLKLAAAEEESWCAWLWRQTPAQWLFRFEYLKYLCIVLPGTMAGDMIYNHLHKADERAGQPEGGQSNVQISEPEAIRTSSPVAQPAGGELRRERENAFSTLFILLLAAIVGVVMWGLFVRQVAVTVVACAVLCAAAGAVLRGMRSPERPLYRRLLAAAVVWLALGLLAEPLEGGIKKDPATISYFFITSALAACVVLIAMVAEARFRLRIRPLEACGANPMLAYTASGYLLMPLVTLAGLAPALQRFAELTPWTGVLRGVILTAAVIAVTVLFTKKRIFWRS